MPYLVDADNISITRTTEDVADCVLYAVIVNHRSYGPGVVQVFQSEEEAIRERDYNLKEKNKYITGVKVESIGLRVDRS